jgi:CP family cyanate transporter-like MFS transporter
MMDIAAPRSGRVRTALLPALILLGLSGIALRIPILAVPPLLPLIRDDFRMSETQIGALVGMPLALFALAAVPGSLLVARLGPRTTLMGGLLIAAFASGARGFSTGPFTLYLASILMGLGVSVMQPALPRLVREWLPDRIALGTVIYTNGMLLGALIPIAFTFPVVMPLVGQNWRWDFFAWVVPVLAIAVLLAIAMPKMPRGETQEKVPDKWWPDWKSPLIWMLGLTFACNNSIYFALNGVLPDFLTETGRRELIGPTLLWLNLSQIIAVVLMPWIAHRMLHRAWPYLVFGPIALLGIIGIAFLDGYWVPASATLMGAATAITFGPTMALAPALSKPNDAHRTAAGTFAIGYCVAVFIPVLCGAFWDLSGIDRLAFVPIAACAIGLTLFGAAMSRFKPYTAAPVKAAA